MSVSVLSEYRRIEQTKIVDIAEAHVPAGDLVDKAPRDASDLMGVQFRCAGRAPVGGNRTVDRQIERGDVRHAGVRAGGKIIRGWRDFGMAAVH
jgi:hypothetical protein